MGPITGPVSVSRRTALVSAAAAMLARPALLRAQSIAPIRIGEISSYAADPVLCGPYRKGWEMALARVNELGGVNGRKLEILARDDGGAPDTAVRLAGELLHDQRVDLLAGGSSSETGLALSGFALANKTLYVAGQPMTDALVWEKGNRYTYRIGPSVFMLSAMLVESALTFPAKTWATIAPDDAFGRAAAAWFRRLLSARRPDVRFVAEQWVPPGRLDSGSAAGALDQAAPDGIFNALAGADLQALLQEGGRRGLFKGRIAASMLLGDPEYLRPLGDGAPPGWIVTGYPWDKSDEPFNKQFVLDYTQLYHEPPGMASVIGVAMVNAIVSGILKSGGTQPEAMADGFAEAGFNTPFGLCQLRAMDHQSTLGAYVGRLAQEDGHGVMVDWRYADGASVMPGDADVRTLRPQ